MNKLFMIAACAALTGVTMAQNVIWDTGVNNAVTFNGNPSNLGLSSGFLGAGFEERWYVMPFKVGAGGATINKVWARGFMPAGSECGTLEFRIWNRLAGNPAPVPAEQVAHVVVDADPGGETIFPTIVDPRTSYEQFFAAPNDKRLASIEGFTPVTLPAGDYWFSVYGAEGLAGGFPNFAWFTGAHNDSIAMNSSSLFGDPNRGMYRQTNLATGFAAYSTAVITAPAFLGDPAERWNTSFTLWGTSARVAQRTSGNVIFNDYVGNEGPYDDVAQFKPLDFLYRVAVTDQSNGNTVAFRYLHSLTQSPGTVDQTVLTTMPYALWSPLASSAAGTVEARFATNNWLARLVSWNTTVNSGDVTQDLDLLNGDVDVDGEIGPSDFGLLSASFGTSGDTVSPGWDTWVASVDGQADLDEDGEVGPADFSVLSANFGESGE